ncbi:MAG: aminoglycoside phosphotransferase family protein [Caldilineaceae bacterium]
MKDQPVSSTDAQEFLVKHFGLGIGSPVLVGEGAWSRCFGFRHGDEELVIRFGKYVDDFEKDQRAYTLASPDLPIPNVLEIGEAFDGYYAISTRAYGIPLEQVSASQWVALLPSLVSALEAMRKIDLSATTGFGGWGIDGNASMPSWSRFLFAALEDTPDRRTHGWRKKLAAHPQAEATFVWGMDLLQQLVNDDVPRSLLHCDLVNRNVLVEGNRLSGIFDWGCSIYGDHFYELAWFDFWSPWYPDLDIGLLHSGLEQHWREVGYTPVDKEARLAACYLHIGLDHLAYNSYTGDEVNLLATAARMRTLVKKG